MNKIIKTIVIVSFITLFSGCLNKTLPSNKVYNLSISENCCQNNFKKKRLVLKVLEPVASKHLNNHSIYYSSEKYRLQTYKLSRWSEIPSKMILEVITSKLDNLNLYENIITSYIYAKPDYTLQSELLEFKQIIDKNSSYSKLKIKFYLIKNNNEKTIISKTFKYQTKSKEINAFGAVEAQNESMKNLIKDLSSWIYQHTKEN